MTFREHNNQKNRISIREHFKTQIEILFLIKRIPIYPIETVNLILSPYCVITTLINLSTINIRYPFSANEPSLGMGHERGNIVSCWHFSSILSIRLIADVGADNSSVMYSKISSISILASGVNFSFKLFGIFLPQFLKNIIAL